MTDTHDHSRLERIVDSKWSAFLARIVTPALVTATLGMGSIIGTALLDEIKSLRAQMLSYQEEIGAVKTEQARVDERMKFYGEMFGNIDRRFERLEDRGKKISDRRDMLTIKALP